jgi:hypothetical protein
MDTKEDESKKRKIDDEPHFSDEDAENDEIRERQGDLVRSIASNIRWLVIYATDLKAMSAMDAEPGTILKMMQMYVEDNWDKEDQFKQLQVMILEKPAQLEQPKK